MDDGGRNPEDVVLPSSPPVFRTLASTVELDSSDTVREDAAQGKSHFWESSATEASSSSKHKVADDSTQPQAKRLCVDGALTDAPTHRNPPACDQDDPADDQDPSTHNRFPTPHNRFPTPHDRTPARTPTPAPHNRTPTPHPFTYRQPPTYTHGLLTHDRGYSAHLQPPITDQNQQAHNQNPHAYGNNPVHIQGAPNPSCHTSSFTRPSQANAETSSATIANSLAQPANIKSSEPTSNFNTPTVALGPGLLSHPDIFSYHIYPWQASPIDDEIDQFLADQNRFATTPQEPGDQQQTSVAPGVPEATPEPSADPEAEYELPHLPQPNHSSGQSGSDDYGFTSSVEHEMACLTDPVMDHPPVIPPSSVIRDMGPPSSISVYDAGLQRSPPAPAITLSKAASEEEDLLDDEVDWDEIVKALPTHPEVSSPLGQPTICAATDGMPTITNTATIQPLQPTQYFQETQATHLAPSQTQVQRLSFPRPAKHNSSVFGVATPVRAETCFRIGQLLNRASQSLGSPQNVVLEFYARVKSSSREPFARVQHFEFLDLFNNYPPYPSGTLVGWVPGSQVDEESAPLLATTDVTPMMCRCLCKMRRDEDKKGGWVMVIESIREADWEEVDGRKEIGSLGQ